MKFKLTLSYILFYPKKCNQHLEDKVKAANETMQSDKRFSSNPLMHLLYKNQPAGGSNMVESEDFCNLHTYPDVWQYRPQITIESLLQYVDRQHGQGDFDGQTSLALLREFLAKVCKVILFSVRF